MKTVKPNLTVADMARSLAFYRDVLGFVPVARIPEENPIFAIMAAGDVEVHLDTRESLRQFGMDQPDLDGERRGTGVNLYFGVDDVDGLYQAVRAGGVAPVFDIRTMPYGVRQFTLADPDGYLLTFAQEVEYAPKEHVAASQGWGPWLYCLSPTPCRTPL